MVFGARGVGVIAVAVASLPPVASANPTMALPDGCHGRLTIQLENCSLLNHWRCDGQPADHYWVSTFDDTGSEVQRRLMRDLTLLEMAAGPGGEQITAEVIDDEALENLWQTGRDTYDSIHSTDTLGPFRRVTGISERTGETRIVDQITLHGVRSTSQFSDMAGATSRKTVLQYITGAAPIWVPDRVIDEDTGDVILSFGPTDFIWPDDPDFMTTRPVENCADPLS